MNDLEVPRQTPESLRDSELQAGLYGKRRGAILKELRVLTGVPEVIRTLNPNETYRVVCTPAGAKLSQGTDGLISGVFRNEHGEIVKHAKLQAVGPSFVKCAAALGSQVLLISIAMQLNRVEEGVNDILEGLHGDRMAEIAAGVTQYGVARDAADRETQLKLTANAIQSLTVGVEKALMALPGQIAKMPDPESGIGDDWPLLTRNRTKAAKDRLRPVQESFWACLVGIRTLAACFAAIDEPHLGADTLRKYIGRLGNSGHIETMIRKARLVPVEEGQNPEAPLREFMEGLSLVTNKLSECDQLAEGHLRSIAIEFSPRELLAIGEDDGGNLSEV